MLLKDYLKELEEKQKQIGKALNEALSDLEEKERSFHTINIEREFKEVFIHNN